MAQVSRSVRRPMRVPQVSAFETWETTNLNRRVLASPNPPAASAPARRRPLPLYLDGWLQTGRVMPATRPRPIFRPCRQTARNRVRDSAIPGLNTRDLGHPLHGSAAGCKAQGQEIVRRRIEWSGRPDSNWRPSAPKADALPDCATPRRLHRLYREPGRRWSS